MRSEITEAAGGRVALRNLYVKGLMFFLGYSAGRDFTLCKSVRPTGVLAAYTVPRFSAEKNFNSLIL